MVKIETTVDNIVSDVSEIKNLLKDHIKWEGSKYNEMSERFSGKWVEKAIIGLASGVALLLIGVLVSSL